MVRKAFTLIELIMVIVVLGIMAMISTDIIVTMYRNYLFTRSVNNLEKSTQAALDQITKRLQYRIKSSTIGRDPKKFKDYVFIEAGIKENHKVLEWIGYSNESLNGNGGALGASGWSGFVDLYNSNTDRNSSKISTLGSNLTVANNIIQALSYGDVSLTKAGNRPAIIFKNVPNGDMKAFGWEGKANDANYTIRVSKRDDETFDIKEAKDNIPEEFTEQYYLAHSAYAVVPVPDPKAKAVATNGNSGEVFDLYLYYNYQPWEGEKYTDSKNKALLAKNVSLFRATQKDGMIVVKLCMADNKGSIDISTTDFRVCKEKVVY